MVNLAIVVNPERVAVGGGITRSWDRIRPRLEAALLAGVPYPPQLVLARFPHDAPLLGAVALAVDALAADELAAGDLTGPPAATTPATAADHTHDTDSHAAQPNGHYCTNRTNSVSTPAPTNSVTKG